MSGRDRSTDVPRAKGSEVQRGQHSCSKQLVLSGVRSWPFWRSDDDTGFPNDAVSSELLSGEVDLEATGEPVPIMDFVPLVAAPDVCDEEISAKQVLNDESCGSALAMRRIVGVPLRELLASRQVVSALQDRRNARSSSSNV